jgi:hypothetical protein
MPLRWRISPLEHLVICEAEGVVTLTDILLYYEALDRAGAFPVQKIFVATTGTSGLSPSEVVQLARQISVLGARGPLGDVAIVAGASRDNKLAEIFRTLAAVNRPLRMFATIHQARRWLSQRPITPFARKTKLGAVTR